MKRNRIHYIDDGNEISKHGDERGHKPANVPPVLENNSVHTGFDMLHDCFLVSIRQLRLEGQCQENGERSDAGEQEERLSQPVLVENHGRDDGQGDYDKSAHKNHDTIGEREPPFEIVWQDGFGGGEEKRLAHSEEEPVREHVHFEAGDEGGWD